MPEHTYFLLIWNIYCITFHLFSSLGSSSFTHDVKTVTANLRVRNDKRHSQSGPRSRHQSTPTQVCQLVRTRHHISEIWNSFQRSLQKVSLDTTPLWSWWPERSLGGEWPLLRRLGLWRRYVTTLDFYVKRCMWVLIMCCLSLVLCLMLSLYCTS